MLYLFSRISTWLFIEMIATLILAILNMIIPILMIFSSYRNLANFYFSSTALSSSLINFLYLFYLIQTLRSKVLSEINCRAVYYLQVSCIVVLGNIQGGKCSLGTPSTSALFQHFSTFSAPRYLFSTFSALFTIFWCMVPALTPLV
jgi:hypothetical protein